MTKKLVVLIICVVSICACSGSPDKDMNMNLSAGLYKYYYPDGSVKEEQTKVNGILEGPTRSYYENGQLKEDTFFENNLLQGPSKKYYENGALKETANWVRGQLEGDYVFYCENGNIQESHQYKSGKPHGDMKKYRDCSTVLEETKTYVDGDLEGERVIFYPDGTPKEKIAYANGNPHGIKLAFYPDGKKKEEEHYENGQYEGVCRYYYPKGSLMQEVHYVNGKKHGMEKLYYKRGNIQKETPYKNGMIDGTVKQYAGSGYLWLTENYRYGQLHGKSIQYSKSGSIIKQLNYVNKDLEKMMALEAGEARRAKKAAMAESRPVKEDVSEPGMENPNAKEVPPYSEAGYGLRYRMKKGDFFHYAALSKVTLRGVPGILAGKDANLEKTLLDSGLSGIFGTYGIALNKGGQRTEQTKFSMDCLEERPDNSFFTRIYLYDINVSLHPENKAIDFDNSYAVDREFKMALSGLGEEQDYSGVKAFEINMYKGYDKIATYSLEQFFLNIFMDWPENPVQLKNRWNRKEKYVSNTPSGMNKEVETETIYVLEGVEKMDDRTCMKIKGTINGTANLTGRASGSEINLNGAITGSVEAYFDYMNGVLIKTSTENVFSGKLSVKMPSKLPFTTPYMETRNTEIALKK